LHGVRLRKRKTGAARESGARGSGREDAQAGAHHQAISTTFL
jgi:hypothetical protein